MARRKPTAKRGKSRGRALGASGRGRSFGRSGGSRGGGGKGRGLSGMTMGTFGGPKPFTGLSAGLDAGADASGRDIGRTGVGIPPTSIDYGSGPVGGMWGDRLRGGGGKTPGGMFNEGITDYNPRFVRR